MRAVLLALLLSTPPAPSSAWRVELKDSVGDVGFSPTGQPAPDLQSGSVELLPDGGLALRVGFVRGTFDSATTSVQFNLDLGPLEPAPNPCERCGNYLVDINGVGPASRKAKVQRLAGSQYEVAGTVPIRFRIDGAEVTIPPSLLPKDIGRAAIRVVTCIRLDGDALSVILDRMPDAGQPPAVLDMARGRRTRS